MIRPFSDIQLFFAPAAFALREECYCNLCKEAKKKRGRKMEVYSILQGERVGVGMCAPISTLELCRNEKRREMEM